MNSEVIHRNNILAAAAIPGASAADQSEVRKITKWLLGASDIGLPLLTLSQVLKLKSLLSRAEIEKRSLQQQLDLKVCAGFNIARALALKTWVVTANIDEQLWSMCNRLLRTRTLLVFAMSCYREWKRADVQRMKFWLAMRLCEGTAQKMRLKSLNKCNPTKKIH
jgi:hypothetical protein